MTLDKLIDSGITNIEILEDLYNKYKADPNSVDTKWQQAFQEIDSTPDNQLLRTSSSSIAAPRPAYPSGSQTNKSSGSQLIADGRVYDLINAYRTYGHLMAKTNPVTPNSTQEPYELRLETHGFHPDERFNAFATCGIMDQPEATLQTIIDVLKSIYSDKIGIEYIEVHSPEMEKWIQERIEPSRFTIDLPIEQKKMILQHLNRSELFESFLQTKYTGQKRFSLEGSETLIPMLEAIVETGSKSGLEDFVIGMAHRGRLNVLANILKKSYSEIFSEFEEGYIPNSFEGSGDVKYHKGFFSEVETSDGKRVSISLPANPSHLEAVDPVVEGQVRAKQTKKNDLEHQKKVIPILIHGDAALSGQGVVYETMQFGKLPGYCTGGTIHIVINNQIGFTTLPKESRSTLYCTDIALAFGSPVFHVNAEDPEGCIYATNLAVELRQKFHCDVFIDLISYRKYGHNETDEPAFTQPLEYQIIRKKKPIREIYRDNLIKEGELEKDLAEKLETEFKQTLQEAQKQIKSFHAEWNEKNNNADSKVDLLAPFPTGVSAELLSTLAERTTTIPEGFNIHPKLENLLKEHRAMVQEGANVRPIDWSMGELLAYASLLWEGVPIRLSGQDSCRGTFSHRHAIWVDQVEERCYSPLSNLKPGQGRFDVYNSPLSEYAVLGFEFGYSISYPESLTIWEAQFGDFCNGAQIIIDQFISTAEQKWGRKSGLTMFLPHGYEGQGPEHSSARMERFLALAGNQNMQIVDPTTPAQFFHLLRRQILRDVRKPLIVFTPKGLLRYPQCVSKLSDLTQGCFQEIIDDPAAPKSPKRIAFCTGRVYYDLIAARAKIKSDDLAIIRIEQLYPLHIEKLKELISKYQGFQDCFWVQEEPSNMGAWHFIHPRLSELLPKNVQLRYIGRSRSASPAVGSHALHNKELAAIINALFNPSQQTLFDIHE